MPGRRQPRVRVRRGAGRRARRRLIRKPTVRRLISSPHYFKVNVGSKDFGSGISVGAGSPGGSLNFSNSGLTTLSTSTIQSTYYFSWAFYAMLQQLPNYTQLAGLFDRYNLMKVQLRFVPVNNVVAAQDAGNTSNAQAGGFLHWITDYDDAVAPTSSDIGIDSLRQRPSYRWCSIQDKRRMSRSFRPRIAVGAYSGAFTSYANRSPGWLDSQSPAVQHYGLKGIFEIMNPNNVTYYINMKCEATLHLRLKDPH